jgi:Na+-transporting methylmalonyl-CoA/oxaloacetate decarboxylase gamma subunit
MVSIGMVVVMGILSLMVFLIEVMVRWDHYVAARSKLAEEEKGEEATRVHAEVFAAIGLALHQLQEEQKIELAVLDRPRYSGWASSGRLDIMAAGQRLTWERPSGRDPRSGR